ncbi:TetR/AcrR family transcriptional regulator [Kitasatospora sp. NPDC096128]|uniref:SbtR family transcriptional regulator n=1 Tax=Kitasatospora sp. NPDC096128 TaxID=3155547 RepID=UPI0033190000
MQGHPQREGDQRRLARKDGVRYGAVDRREGRLDRVAGVARTECLQHPDAGQGLTRYLHYVGEVLDGDRGLSAAIEAARGSASTAPTGETRGQLESAVGALIEQGRAAGSIRGDSTVADVYMIVGCLSAVIRTDSGDWRRLIDLALDGLRPR